MIKNYLVVAWRNLLRYRVYSLINLTGLSIGLTICMLIVIYVSHESAYDRFHPNAGRTFWMQTRLLIGGDSIFIPNLPYSAAPVAAQREPTIESFVRTRKAEPNTIVHRPEKPELKYAEEKFLFADSNFFSFFNFPLASGNATRVLNRPLAVVVARRAAIRYFGTEDPVGKTLRFDNKYDFLITGIADNPPSNSTIQFEFIASLSSLRSMPETVELVTKDKNDFTTYIRMHSAKAIAKTEAILARIMAERDHDDKMSIRYNGIPLPDLHIKASQDFSNLKYIRIFPFIGALVLLLALINYVSLSTARATTRAREIGVRKVLGAERKRIALQFFVESTLFTSIAFVAAYIVCLVIQPLFFRYLQLDIDQAFLYRPVNLVLFASLFMVTSLVAGTYPALLLSAFRPVAVLYGKWKPAGNLSFRKFFTVLQFSIAVIFIISGLVMQQQLFFFRNMDTGVDRSNVVMLPFGKNVASHFEAFNRELGALKGVVETSVALHPLFREYDMMGLTPPGATQPMLIPTLDVDQHFIPLLGLKWKIPPDDSFFYRSKNRVLLNETALQSMNLGPSPLHQKLDEFELAGVLKDFNWSSLQQKIQPLLITVSEAVDTGSMWARKGGCAFARIAPGTNLPSLLDGLRELHMRYDAEQPFTYFFMDDAFDALYRAEERLTRLLTIFTGLSVLIACLGLLGLVTFMAAQRTKEIGIRKTLGASVRQIVRLLTAEFIWLVGIAVVAASPVAWYFMHRWLEDFAYRISLSGWIFAAGAAIALVIALLTISVQAIRAATANPVKALRNE